MKYYIYEFHQLDNLWYEVPYEKREWWELRHSSSSKEEALAWLDKYKTKNTRYKLVSSALSLKDMFFPRCEVKKRTHTARFLKQINYCP